MPAEIEIPFYFSMKGLASENPAFFSKQLRRCVRVSLFKKMKKFDIGVVRRRDIIKPVIKCSLMPANVCFERLLQSTVIS